MQRKIKLPIPKREGAPATNLFVQIVYKDEESLKTKPYVFMLPGGPGSNHSFYQDYACLSDEVNVVFHDPRGCGLSDKGDPSTYTMDNYIQDVNVIRQHLELEKITLLGKSYGAMCALYFTLEYPQVVERVVIAAGVPTDKFLETAKLNIEKRGTAEQKKVCKTLFDGDFKDDEELAYYFSVTNTLYSYRKRHDLPVNRPEPEYPFAADPLNLGFRDFLRKFDFTSRLSEVKCPTLVLVGEEDWICDPIYSQMMADGIKGSKFIKYEKSDHSMESDVPDKYFKDINDFVRLHVKKKLKKYSGSQLFHKNLTDNVKPDAKHLALRWVL